MKHTLLALLLFLSFCSFSQNYKGVVMSDTTYYTGGDYYTPHPWQTEYIPNLLRTIWIKDVQLIGTDSVYSFYPSVRRDHNTTFCVDTAGPTWLGKGFTRKPDGTEIYKNYKNEEIHIHTLAPLNDTWKITTDSAGTEFWGTVSQISVTQIDNTTDSIKEITLQAFVAGNPVANIMNGKKIMLSKEHGFYKTFEFYIFPYEDNGTGFAFGDYFPVDSSSYSRLNKDLTTNDHYKFNFQSMFSIGTKWQYVDSVFFSSNPNSNWFINVDHIQDSVISKNLISPDTLVISKHRIKVTHTANGQGPAPNNPLALNYISTTTSIMLDTLVVPNITPTQGIIRNHLYPEYTHSVAFNPSYTSMPSYKFSRLTDSIYLLAKLFTNDHPIHYDMNNSCITAQTTTSAGLIYDIIGFIPNANFREYYHFTTDGFSGAVSNVQRTHLLYYQDGTNSSETWGTPLNMIALSTEDISSTETPISVSPNPSFSGLFKINSTEGLQWEVHDLNGRKITQGNSSEINLIDNSSGMYLLKVISRDRSYFSKLVR